MSFQFTPPTTVEEAQPDTGPLLSRYTLARGVSVLKSAGVYTERRFPSLDELLAADLFYLGGHIYPVDATEKAALEAAGYTVETV